MWEVLIPVIVGGTIGVVGSLAGPVLLEVLRTRAERKALVGALVAEIQGIINIVERRQYIEGLRHFLATAEQDPSPENRHFYAFQATRNPFAVFDASLARLGVVPDPLRSSIVRFYTQASSVMEDIRDMAHQRTVPQSRDESLQRLRTLLDLFEDTLRVGREVVARNDSGAP